MARKTPWGTPFTGNEFQMAALGNSYTPMTNFNKRNITNFQGLPGASDYGSSGNQQTSIDAKATTDAYMAKINAESDARDKMLQSIRTLPPWQRRQKMLASKLFANKEIDDLERELAKDEANLQNRVNALSKLPGSQQQAIPGAMGLIQNYNQSIGLPGTEAGWQELGNQNAAMTARNAGVGLGRVGNQSFVAPWQPVMSAPMGDAAVAAQIAADNRNREMRSNMNLYDRPGRVATAGMAEDSSERPQAWLDYKADMRKFLEDTANGQTANYPGAWEGPSGMPVRGEKTKAAMAALYQNPLFMEAQDRRNARTQQARDMITARANGVNPLMGTPFGNLMRGTATQDEMAAMFPALAPMYAAQAQVAQDAEQSNQRTKMAQYVALTNALATTADPQQRKFLQDQIAGLGMNGAQLPGTQAPQNNTPPAARSAPVEVKPANRDTVTSANPKTKEEALTVGRKAGIPERENEAIANSLFPEKASPPTNNLFMDTMEAMGAPFAAAYDALFGSEPPPVAKPTRELPGTKPKPKRNQDNRNWFKRTNDAFFDLFLPTQHMANVVPRPTKR